MMHFSNYKHVIHLRGKEGYIIFQKGAYSLEKPLF